MVAKVENTTQPIDKIEVIRWGSYDENLPESVGGLGGWFNPPFGDNSHTWQDFIDSWTPEGQEYIWAIRASVVANQIRRGGDWHQNDPNGVPVFSDGTCGSFSWRAWGDLLAAIWTDEDGVSYSYMDFYMDDYGHPDKRTHGAERPAET